MDTRNVVRWKRAYRHKVWLDLREGKANEKRKQTELVDWLREKLSPKEREQCAEWGALICRVTEES